MTNPTSNYNFQMPTSTDLVTDLPADFEVFGQAVDTRLKALQPGTTLGDLAYSSATANTNTRLPIGTSGQVLAVSGGGVPAWTTTADVTPLTTKGDLFTFSTVDARLGVGTNGQVLTADSTAPTGLAYTTPAAGAMTVIASGSLTGSSVSITSIPQTYVHLQLVIDAFRPTNAADNLYARINSDATVNRHLSTTNSAGSGLAFNNTRSIIATAASNGSGSSSIGMSVLNLYNYISTTAWKMGEWNALVNNQASPTTANSSVGLIGYNQTTAITSLDILPENTTFAAGTYILYGVK